MVDLITHASLLARLEGNDPLAWRDFVDRYGALIVGFARRRGLQSADAEDLVQDVLMALMKAMPGFRYDPGRGRFRAYLKTVCLNAIRRRQGRALGTAHEQMPTALPDDESDPGVQEAWESEWRQYHLARAMRHIEREFQEGDRSAFQLYAVEGKDAGITARSLGLSVDQVYQAKSRIMRRLATLIAAQVEDEG